MRVDAGVGLPGHPLGRFGAAASSAATPDRVPRNLAKADFFAIFQAAERNTEAAILAEREQAHRDEAELKRLCSLAERTLAGEFGSDEKKLGTHLLLDERGRCATELRALREFRRALTQLKRER